MFGSLDVGSAVGLLVCGPLIHAFGWPSVFYLFAALGLVWSAAWPLLKPEQADPDVPAPPPSSSPSVSGATLTRGGQKALCGSTQANVCNECLFGYHPGQWYALYSSISSTDCQSHPYCQTRYSLCASCHRLTNTTVPLFCSEENTSDEWECLLTATVCVLLQTKQYRGVCSCDQNPCGPSLLPTLLTTGALQVMPFPAALHLTGLFLCFQLDDAFSSGIAKVHAATAC